MTRKDFELIASTLAYCESHCDDDKETAMVEWIVEKFADALAAGHPRFNRGRFEVYALPIKHAELRRRIVEKLGTGQAV